MSAFLEKLFLVLAGVILSHVIPFLYKKIKAHLSGRSKIKQQIEHTINNEFKVSLKENCGIEILEKGLCIEWDEIANSQSYLNNDGDVVIKLSIQKDKNLSRCLVKTIMLYLEEAFMPEAKPFIGYDIHDGCKFTLAKEITFKKNAETFRHFLSDYLSPKLLNDLKFETLINKLDLMSKKGNFRSIFLRELFLLCEQGSLPKSDMRDEVKEFLEFIYNIANKKEYFQDYGELPSLKFIKKYIKIAVILVKRRTIQDITAHIVAVKHSFEEGAKNVYITGWGRNNIDNVKNIARRLESTGYKPICEIRYIADLETSVQEALCYVFCRKK